MEQEITDLQKLYKQVKEVITQDKLDIIIAAGKALKDADAKIDELESNVTDLAARIEDLEEEAACVIETEEYFVGLDTIHIAFSNDNLLIKQKVADFIEQLQKENSAPVTSFI